MTENNFKEKDFFVCKQCGDCCLGAGGTEIDEDDIEKISAFIKKDKEEFIENYCTTNSRKEFMIKQAKDGKCIFFNKNCSIHPVKPSMCRDWPFISNIIKNPNTWYMMAEACPGINKEVSISNLLKFVKKRINNNNKVK